MLTTLWNDGLFFSSNYMVSKFVSMCLDPNDYAAGVFLGLLLLLLYIFLIIFFVFYFLFIIF